MKSDSPAARTEQYADNLSIEVDVRGDRVQVRWSDAGMEGDADAIARISRSPIAPVDPISFLQAARVAFGEAFVVSAAWTVEAVDGPLLATG